VLDSPIMPVWKSAPVPFPMEYTGVAVLVPPLPVVLPEPEPLPPEPEVLLPPPLRSPLPESPQPAKSSANPDRAIIDANLRMFLS
jgi:hypothetical protein